MKYHCDFQSSCAGPSRLLRRYAPNKKTGHFLAIIRRGNPPFFIQGGSAAGRWETRNDKYRHCERSEAISQKAISTGLVVPTKVAIYFRCRYRPSPV